MGTLLRPTLLAQAIWRINLDGLWDRGIRGVILDLDNTIAYWRDHEVVPEAQAWIAAARRRGLNLCLASNAVGTRRVKQVAEELGVAAVVRAGKPLPKAFHRAMAVMGTGPENTCVVGDQVFTDIAGANWLGLTTILVEPLSAREPPHTWLIRLIERPLRRRWARLALDASQQGGEL